jgi:hypothetical protein
MNPGSGFDQMMQGYRSSRPKDIIPKGYRQGQMQQFTPEQMQMFQQLFGYLSSDSPLSRMASGDQSYFDEMESPALRQAGALQGNLASRFSGMGMGGRHSSGFQNTSSQAMNEFAEGLASKRQDYMRQAIMDLMGYSNMLLGQRPYEKFLAGKDQSPSTGSSILGGLLPLAGGALGGFFGGPFGAMAGSSIGSAAGRGFMGG